jgi:SulP family sulfate permease
LVLFALGAGFGLLWGIPSEVLTEQTQGLRLLPYGWPSQADFLWVLPVLVLPQLPTTLGNAIVSNVEISHELYPPSRQRVTHRAVTLSMALINMLAFLFGAVPLCHGAGGLMAHYRFGARSCGSNIIIGSIMMSLALFLGGHLVSVLKTIPLPILGVLLIFAGLQLALMVEKLEHRNDYSVALVMLVTTLATNLSIGFVVATLLSHLLIKKSIVL